jgi:uncharacterized protein YecE (DUF72 family)
MTIYLGTQGWSYKSWEGVFYRKDTPSTSYLSEYARKLGAVEIDSTYYATPRASTVKQWDQVTPEGFRFTAKFPQKITHEKMLKEVGQDVAFFLDTMSLLGPKLGPLLIQFPYTFKPDQRTVLEEFLAALPPSPRFRYAVEVRQRGWLQDWFFDLLTRHGVALVLADYAYMPRLARQTTDFAYIRWLGNRKDVPDDEYDHVRINRDKELDHWTGVIADLVDKGVTIWGFANNHYMGHSPATLSEIRTRLSERGITG